MRTLICLITLSIALVACGNSDTNSTNPQSHQPKTTTEMRGAEFSSIQQCLKSIKRDTKLSLNIVIDQPDEVTGSLGNTDRTFACQVKETGSQGTFVKGWYTVEVEVY